MAMDLGLLDCTYLRIAGCVPESFVDGPGFRYTVFTQGCPFHCKGCHNPQAQSLDGGIEVPLKVIYEEIRQSPLVSGVTFSGGEPFIQSRALTVFSRILLEKGYSLWAYSGYTFDKLLADPARLEFLKCLEVVVDGPYVESQHSYDLDFRGSSNQRIIDVPASLAAGHVVLKEGFR